MGFIGVVDSGIGGLTVLQNLRSQHACSFVYIADHAFCPYGTKSNEVVFSRARKLVAYLKNHGAQAVVLACNTMSVYADRLRQLYGIPVYDVIIPTCKRVVNSSAKSVALLATRSTISNGAYQAHLSRCGICVYTFDCSAFVPFVEQRTTTSLACQQTVDQALHSLPQTHADAVILGCTHFPLLRSQISYYCPNALVFESGCDLPADILFGSDTVQSTLYLTTGDVDFANGASAFLKDARVRFKHISLD